MTDSLNNVKLMERKENIIKKEEDKNLENDIFIIYSNLFLPIEIDFNKLYNDPNLKIIKILFETLLPSITYEKIKEEMIIYKKSFWYLFNNYKNNGNTQNINNMNRLKQELIKYQKLFVEHLNKSPNIALFLNIHPKFPSENFNKVINALEYIFDEHIKIIKKRCQETSVIKSYEHLKNKTLDIIKTDYYGFLVKDHQIVVNYLNCLKQNKTFQVNIQQGQCTDTFYNMCHVIVNICEFNMLRKKRITSFFDPNYNFINSNTKNILSCFTSDEIEKIVDILKISEGMDYDELNYSD